MSGTPTRNTAIRAFGEEISDATYLYQEGDDDRAPRFAVLPTGVRANRYAFVGTLTERKDVGNDDEYWQGRIVGPAEGKVFTYAGQYQQAAAATLRSATDLPKYCTLVGKPRTYETDDGDVNVSIRPESITLTDDDEGYHNFAVETAKLTLERIEDFEEAFENGTLSDSQRIAMEQYGPGEGELPPLDTYRERALHALELASDYAVKKGAESGEAADDNDETSEEDTDKAEQPATPEPEKHAEAPESQQTF